ncbi:hypothetical protein BIW11_04332 [Tropilaelaps mercedesae]|uniref:Uncharacterized protein n=1 Tax=Tropilaelaps mercedesae TaxID=418985 RepID=A0A1V9X897_9ACAR|nr:hypothetical protein BIW11_04332 [Tropilaelaps mercedesae]
MRAHILRQSRKYRLEDLLKESRLRLLKSSGQTLSTVQNALSAFQEARVRMIQARLEEWNLVDSSPPKDSTDASKQNYYKKKIVSNTKYSLQREKEGKDYRRRLSKND